MLQPHDASAPVPLTNRSNHRYLRTTGGRSRGVRKPGRALGSLPARHHLRHPGRTGQRVPDRRQPPLRRAGATPYRGPPPSGPLRSPVPAAPQRRGSGQQPALRGCGTHPARPLQGRAAAAPCRVPQPQPQPGGRHVQGAPAAGGRHLGAARAHQRLGPLPARRFATGPYHCRGARGGEEKKGRKGNGRDSAAGRTTAE